MYGGDMFACLCVACSCFDVNRSDYILYRSLYEHSSSHEGGE